MQAKYIGKTNKWLKHNNEYIVKFTEPKGHCYVYDCHIIFDIKEQEDMDVFLNYASEISIKQNWEYNRLELDNE